MKKLSKKERAENAARLMKAHGKVQVFATMDDHFFFLKNDAVNYNATLKNDANPEPEIEEFKVVEEVDTEAADKEAADKAAADKAAKNDANPEPEIEEFKVVEEVDTEAADKVDDDKAAAPKKADEKKN